MADGLRERKRQELRARLVTTAAHLFAERGFEGVTVTEVAAAAGVAPQTVYNHFPAKEQLLLDHDEELRDQLTELVRDRPSGVGPAAALRPAALSFVEGIRSLSTDDLAGGLGHLAAKSPTVRRLSLEMTDRHADAIATALVETTPMADPAQAKVPAVALAWVFQTVTDETGRRSVAGLPADRIADEVRAIVTTILDDLERWPVDDLT